MKTRLILLFLLCIVSKAWAQIPIVRNFTNMDYQAGTQNWDIAQTSAERMAFANNAGLLKYDGNKWQTLPIDGHSNVRAIHYDEKRNRVYAGGTDEFGFFHTNPHTHQSEYRSLSAALPAAQRSFGEIWHIHRLQGSVVFVGKNHLFQYTPGKILKTIFIRERIETSAIINNKLIIACQDKLYTFDGNNLRSMPSTDMLKGQLVRAVLPMNGKILLLAANGKMFVHDGQKVTPLVWDISPHLEAFQVFCATVSGHYLAIGTIKNGLIVKNMETGKNWYVNASTGLQNNTILSLQFDRNNNIWLGLDNGIAYVIMETPFANLLGNDNSIGTGYASYADGNKLYLGTNQGLFFIDARLSNQPTPAKATPVTGVMGQIWSLTKIQGHMLCGADMGAFVIRDGRADKIAGTMGTWGFRRLTHHPGYILACDYQGFIVLRESGNSLEMVNRVSGFSTGGGNFEEDTDGTIWLSHWQKGIYHLWLSDDLKRVTKTQLFNHANGLTVDDNHLIAKIQNKIYVSSADGLRYYDKHTQQLKKEQTLTKAFHTYGQALRITELPNGNLLAHKDHYLAIAGHTQGGYKVDSLSYGNLVNRLQMSLGHIGILDDKHLLLNYDNGFYVIPNTYKGTTRTSHLLLRSVWSTSAEKDSLLYAYHPHLQTDKIQLPHSLNSIRIEFVMPEYRDNQAVEYACILEGYDNSWTAYQTATYKEYTQLSRGTYTFRIKARNLVTGEMQETSIDIKVLPAWYETWLAYFAYIILIAIGIRLLAKYLQRRAERHLVRLREEKERQLKEQQTLFMMQEEKKEKELVKLRNNQLTIELKHKSGELADSTMNLVRKNDMLLAIDQHMEELVEGVRKQESKEKITKKINDIRREIKYNMTEDDNWEKFQENFNLVYDNFMQKLTARFSDLKKNDLKLCAYLKMGLSSKEMASLLNTSVRSIETARYRLRKKLELDSGENLTLFIQNVDKEKHET